MQQRIDLCSSLPRTDAHRLMETESLPMKLTNCVWQHSAPCRNGGICISHHFRDNLKNASNKAGASNLNGPWASIIRLMVH